mgnify:CR=1 FL=1
MDRIFSRLLKKENHEETKDAKRIKEWLIQSEFHKPHKVLGGLSPRDSFGGGSTVSRKRDFQQPVRTADRLPSPLYLLAEA